MKAVLCLFASIFTLSSFAVSDCAPVPQSVEKSIQFELERAGFYERVVGQIGCTFKVNPNNDEMVSYVTNFSGGKVYPHGEFIIVVKVLVDTYHTGMGNHSTSSTSYIDY